MPGQLSCFQDMARVASDMVEDSDEGSTSMIKVESQAAATHVAVACATGLVSAGRIEGASIHNRDGDYVGHVENVLVDPNSGRIAIPVVSLMCL